uniref:metastasis-suppressor KiSS-1 n=1 Tax=Euleptes europaea TaxID=460621 RepID=UPI0025402DE6|nr:metastasis-suppressor KiSS-1 [Euleptes europaea]
MSLFSSMLLFLLFFRAHFGEPTDNFSVLKDAWHEDELAKNFGSPIHWANTIPCPERQSSSGTAGLKSTPSLLCKRQEPQMQSWQGMSPVKSRVISIPQEARLVELEKELSTYNWNSFGLRYGKRQAVKPRCKYDDMEELCRRKWQGEGGTKSRRKYPFAQYCDGFILQSSKKMAAVKDNA